MHQQDQLHWALDGRSDYPRSVAPFGRVRAQVLHVYQPGLAPSWLHVQLEQAVRCGHVASEEVAQLQVPHPAEHDGLAAIRGDVPLSVGDPARPRVVQERDAGVLDPGPVRAFRLDKDSDLQGGTAGAQRVGPGNPGCRLRLQQSRQSVHRYGAEFIDKSEHKIALSARCQFPHQGQVSDTTHLKSF